MYDPVEVIGTGECVCAVGVMFCEHLDSRGEFPVKSGDETIGTISWGLLKSELVGMKGQVFYQRFFNPALAESVVGFEIGEK